MSQLVCDVVEKLIAEGQIPSEHRQMAMKRLEHEVTRRTHWILRGLAREAVGVAQLGRASAA